MTPRITIIAMSCILLTGCLGVNGGARHINGEDLGLGHCRHPGIAEISLMGIQEAPNATVTVEIMNLYRTELSFFGWLGIVGQDGKSESFSEIYADDLGEYNRLEPGETATITWKIPDFPPTPWKRFSISYAYSKDETAVNLRCSLVGDNAPWAFEAKA